MLIRALHPRTLMFFDGEGGGGGGEGGAGNGTPTTFTQEQVNDLLAREKGKITSKYADYNDLKSKADRLKEIEDATKSDLEKLTGDRDSFKGRAETAESKLARFEAAAKAGLPAEHAHRITGSTPKELEDDAKKLVDALGGGGTGFDGGARGNGGKTDDPDTLIRRMAGRNV